MLKNDRRSRCWVSEGSSAGDLPTLTYSCSVAAGAPWRLTQLMRCLRKFPGNKVFCVSSAGPWGVRVQNKTWMVQSDWVGSWSLVLIQAIGYKSWQASQLELKEQTNSIWGDLKVAMYAFGGNSEVISHILTEDIGLMQTHWNCILG